MAMKNGDIAAAMEEVLGAYVMGDDAGAQGIFESVARDLKGVDISAMPREDREKLFVNELDGFSLDKYVGLFVDDFGSLPEERRERLENYVEGNDLPMTHGIESYAFKRKSDEGIAYLIKTALLRRGVTIADDVGDRTIAEVARSMFGKNRKFSEVLDKIKKGLTEEAPATIAPPESEDYAAGGSGAESTPPGKRDVSTGERRKEPKEPFYKSWFRKKGKPEEGEKSEGKEGERKEPLYKTWLSNLNKIKEEYKAKRQERKEGKEAKRGERERQKEEINLLRDYTKAKGGKRRKVLGADYLKDESKKKEGEPFYEALVKDVGKFFKEGVPAEYKRITGNIKKEVETYKGKMRQRKLEKEREKQGKSLSLKTKGLHVNLLADMGTGHETKEKGSKKGWKYAGIAGGVLGLGLAGYLLVNSLTHQKMPEYVPSYNPSAQSHLLKIRQIAPSDSVLGNDIEWIWETDKAKWDKLPAAENSRKVGSARKYDIVTDVSLHRNPDGTYIVRGLVHPDATNRGEKVDYIGVRIGDGNWVYLESGSEFRIPISTEEALNMANHAGRVPYQVVGLHQLKGRKFKVKASYRNAELNLSRDGLKRILGQELAYGHNESVKESMRKVPHASSSLDSVRGDVEKSFPAYLSASTQDEAQMNMGPNLRVSVKNMNGGSDVYASLADLKRAEERAVSIANLFNDGVSLRHIARQYRIGMNEVYQNISDARNYGEVIKLKYWKNGLVQQLFSC